MPCRTADTYLCVSCERAQSCSVHKSECNSICISTTQWIFSGRLRIDNIRKAQADIELEDKTLDAPGVPGILLL